MVHLLLCIQYLCKDNCNELCSINHPPPECQQGMQCKFIKEALYFHKNFVFFQFMYKFNVFIQISIVLLFYCLRLGEQPEPVQIAFVAKHGTTQHNTTPKGISAENVLLQGLRCK